MDDIRIDVTGFSHRLDEKLELNRKWRRNPLFWEEHLLWRPCSVRILLVCDDFLYFSDEDFGLSDLIGVLKDEPFPFARFDISAAHRSNISGPRLGVGNARLTRTIAAFNFADPAKFDPSLYDQVWLFGSARSRRQADGQWSGRLSDSELRVLCQFMNGGGGVFATGDHEDLGCAMGGFLPRVRAMRRWFFPMPGPNGEGLAPPIGGEGRFDTNREGPTGGYQFDDQSDVVPQVIEPKYYTARTFILRETAWPHPLLCGPGGVITVLPDHPHESQCTVAADLNWTPVIDGLTVTEFPPAVDGGARPVPEVVAWSRVIGGHSTSGKTGTTISRRFGAIGAYDGHRAGVGRVVTDATWHHFINVNLTGSSGSSFPKTIGFLATPQGQAHYAEIQAYFRNIALWLARPQKITCMRNWGLLLVIHSHRLQEVFDPDIRLGTAKVNDLIIIGRHARDTLGRYASQCQSYRWLIDLVLARIPVRRWIDPIDPWSPVEEFEEGDPRQNDAELHTLVDLEWMGEAALGGAVLALREKLFPLDKAGLERLDDDALDKLVDMGAATAIRTAGQFLHEGLRGLDEFARRLSGNRKATAD